MRGENRSNNTWNIIRATDCILDCNLQGFSFSDVSDDMMPKNISTSSSRRIFWKGGQNQLACLSLLHAVGHAVPQRKGEAVKVDTCKPFSLKEFLRRAWLQRLLEALQMGLLSTPPDGALGRGQGCLWAQIIFPFTTVPEKWFWAVLLVSKSKSLSLREVELPWEGVVLPPAPSSSRSLPGLCFSNTGCSHVSLLLILQSGGNYTGFKVIMRPMEGEEWHIIVWKFCVRLQFEAMKWVISTAHLMNWFELWWPK